MPAAQYTCAMLWTLRVYAWMIPAVSWIVLHDLETLDGRGYWTFFWPIWLQGLILAVGLEIYHHYASRPSN